MTTAAAEKVTAIIGGHITGILDAIVQFASEQVTAAVTPREARSIT
jgi:hypothetical protein